MNVGGMNEQTNEGLLCTRYVSASLSGQTRVTPLRTQVNPAPGLQTSHHRRSTPQGFPCRYSQAFLGLPLQSRSPRPENQASQPSVNTITEAVGATGVMASSDRPLPAPREGQEGLARAVSAGTALASAQFLSVRTQFSPWLPQAAAKGASRAQRRRSR